MKVSPFVEGDWAADAEEKISPTLQSTRKIHDLRARDKIHPLVNASQR
jgi:hypothetical protein